MIHGRENVHIGNINSPNQVVLSGNTEAVKNLSKRLKEMGYRATLLRVSMAFHSPIMKVIHDELERTLPPFHFIPEDSCHLQHDHGTVSIRSRRDQANPDGPPGIYRSLDE